MKDFQFDSFSMKKYIEGVYVGEFDSDNKKEGRELFFIKMENSMKANLAMILKMEKATNSILMHLL